MGFFSDLKDDLSQAVDALMPEEELQAALADDAAGEEVVLGAQDGMPTADDLSSMLDMMEAIGTGTEMEEPVVEEAAADLEADLELPEMEVIPETVEEPLLEEPLPEEPLPEEPTADEPLPEEPVAEEPLPEEPVLQEAVMTEEEPAVQEAPPKKEEVKKAQAEKKGEGRKMELQGKVMSDETAVVTEGMSITGDISSGGSLELIGSVIGNIEILGKLNITGSIQGNSKAAEIFAEGARINGEINSGGSVKIGQSSVIIGNIFANSAVIAGAVKGDIDVHGPVILDTSAIVMGNIKSKSVQINNGAVIEGMCSQCYADVNPTSFFEDLKKKKEK